jgi:hypothetical protein
MSAGTPYSASVSLWLVVDGVSLALSHVGPNELIVRDACEPIPSGDAKLYIRVDNSKRMRKVFLPNGIPGPHAPVMFLYRPPAC